MSDASSRPPTGTSVVRIQRLRSGWRDRFRRYELLLDGQAAGPVKNGEVIELLVAPGQHVLKVKIDWKGSDEKRFTIEANQTAEFRCAPAGPASAGLTDVSSKDRPWVDLWIVGEGGR